MRTKCGTDKMFTFTYIVTLISWGVKNDNEKSDVAISPYIWKTPKVSKIEKKKKPDPYILTQNASLGQQFVVLRGL